MKRMSIDWPHHIAAFRASGQTFAEYCGSAGIKPAALQYQLYKKNAKRRRAANFRELAVATELVIARDQRGLLSLSGFDITHLPQMIGAWSNALS